MQELNRTETVIYIIGAMLTLVGAAANIFQLPAAPYIFALGALAFCAMQMKQRYDGQNVTLRRLRRMMLLSDALLLLTAVLMFANQSNMFGIDHTTYLKYIHNNWVVALLVAAVLQLYSTQRISTELEKEAKKL